MKIFPLPVIVKTVLKQFPSPETENKSNDKVTNKTGSG